MSDFVQENGASPALGHVHHTMLDGLGQLADYFGFSKVVGQLYGALLLSNAPLCLDDLVEQLAPDAAMYQTADEREFWANPPGSDEPEVADPAPVGEFLKRMRRGAPDPRIKVR